MKLNPCGTSAWRLRLAPALCATAAALRLGAEVLHVSPAGDDDGDGSAARPLRTAQAAVDRAAKVHAEAVEFADGRYPLEKPLRLGPANSGLILRAAHPGRTELAGSRTISGWKRSQARAGVWEATLPEVAAGRGRFRDLFVDGTRAQPARAPKTGYFRFAGPMGTAAPIEAPFRAGDLRPEWAGSPDVRVVILMKWTDLHLPILSVEEARHTVRFPGGPRPSWMDEPDARYWVENAPEALDTPGEWQLDSKTGVVRYFGGPGFAPDKARITAPALEQLVLIEGEEHGRAAEGIRLQGLRFAETDYPLPAQGMIVPQAAEPVRGVLAARHAVRCAVEGCTFAGLGGYAIDLGRGCQGWYVSRNTIQDMGAGGVRIGEPGDRDPSAYDACHSHVVQDNEMARLGRVFNPASGVVIFQSGANHIAHNHIHDLYYTGISVGWTWGYQPSPCRGNVIEFNVVEDAGQGRLSDMGGIYTLGPQPGTVVRGNIFRRVTSYDYGGWGLYTDEGSTGILLENNLSVGCKSAGLHQHYGRDNVFRWNLLVDNVEHSMMRTRNEDHRSFWFTNNVVVFRSGELLGSDWAGDAARFAVDGNLYWNPALGADAGAYMMAGKTFPQWQASGRDAASRIADPLFKDPGRPELGFLPSSPVWSMGFHWLDLSTAGVRPQ